jgi:hypothetical protein
VVIHAGESGVLEITLGGGHLEAGGNLQIFLGYTKKKQA